MEQLQQQIRALGDDDFRTLTAWIVGEERQARAARPAVEQAQAEIIVDLRESGQIESPDVADEGAALADVPLWVDPGVIHARMYTKGQRVRTSANRVVESVHPGLNHWNPEDSAIPAAVMETQIWRDVTAEYEQPAEPGEPGEPEQPQVPEFKHPTGAHDAYSKGDRVMWNGDVMESLIDANAYSPADYPAGWRKVEA